MKQAGLSSLANAVAVKRLDHPNIVRVHDVATDGSRVWMAMDLAGGGSLADRLERAGGRLSLDEVVRVATSVCSALSYAHAHGVLHLDVKPANVLFAADGRVLLADFGADVRGTPGYAPPEVERCSATVDARADVYGVGALVAAMTGPGRSSLGPVVARAMAREPGARYATVDELAAALRAAARSSAPTRAVVPALPADAGTRPFGPRPPHPEPPSPAPSGRRRWLLLGLMAVLAVACGASSAPGERREHGACPHPATPQSTSSEGAPVRADRAERADRADLDLDGDGCADPVSIAGNVVAWNGLRFAVGSPEDGDVVLVGDWDCDGVATVATWRPSSGDLYVFDGWAGPGDGSGSGGEVLAPARRVSLPPGGGPPTPCRG